MSRRTDLRPLAYSLTEHHIEDSNVSPVITICQALGEDFPELDELIAEIEITLVHEIAHFMGLDERLCALTATTS